MKIDANFYESQKQKEMTRSEFEKLVEESFLTLPEHIRKKIDNVAIVIEKRPYQKFLIGLYEGIPKTTWDRGFGMQLPDKITIFQEPIERLARSKEELKEIVKDTIWHEIAHHFGLDEKRVKQAESRRIRKK